MEFYSGYKPAPPVDLIFDEDENCTEQNHAADCDINLIIERSKRTGFLGDPFAVPSNPAQYGDFTNVGDYQTAMNHIVAAQNAFDSLPAKIRKEFDNDPAKLLEFVGKEENYDEAVRLGIISRRSDPEPSPAPVGSSG